MWQFDYSHYLCHHGVKGMKWGVRNGPPYPIRRNGEKSVLKSSSHGKIESSVVKKAIRSGEVSTKINPDKQKRHTLHGHPDGRSYLNGDVEYAQELVNKLSGTGKPKMDRNGVWTHKEMVTSPHIIGTHVSSDGVSTKTNAATIVYSKTGSHIYPRKGEKNES